jgi:hypothetical protein
MSIAIPNDMELCRTYGAMEGKGILGDRVAPYPKLFHPFRVFIESTLITNLTNLQPIKRDNIDNYWTKIVQIGTPRSA